MAIVYQGNNRYRRVECGEARSKIRTDYSPLIDITTVINYDMSYPASYAVQFYIYLPEDIYSVDIHVYGEIDDTDGDYTVVDDYQYDVQEGYLPAYETDNTYAINGGELNLYISPRGADASKYKAGTINIRL